MNDIYSVTFFFFFLLMRECYLTSQTVCAVPLLTGFRMMWNTASHNSALPYTDISVPYRIELKWGSFWLCTENPRVILRNSRVKYKCYWNRSTAKFWVQKNTPIQHTYLRRKKKNIYTLDSFNKIRYPVCPIVSFWVLRNGCRSITLVSFVKQFLAHTDICILKNQQK